MFPSRGYTLRYPRRPFLNPQAAGLNAHLTTTTTTIFFLLPARNPALFPPTSDQIIKGKGTIKSSLNWLRGVETLRTGWLYRLDDTGLCIMHRRQAHFHRLHPH